MVLPWVISLGGSVAFPDGPDKDFIRDFVDIVSKQVEERGQRFIIVVGGGGVARQYQDKARYLLNLSKESCSANERSSSLLENKVDCINVKLDNLGILATRLNAYFLWSVMSSKISNVVFKEDPFYERVSGYNILVTGGSHPGQSTDSVAVDLFIDSSGKKPIINITKNPFLYSEDPKINPDAMKYDEILWEDYLERIGDKKVWKPGLSLPFDPVAAQKANIYKIPVKLVSDSGSLERLINEGFDEVDGTYFYSY